MPQAKVKCETRFRGLDGDPEVVMTIDLVPRGSGNRNYARRLAQAVKVHPVMGEHVLRATAGASRVVVVLRPSLEAMQAVLDLRRQERERRQLEREQAGGLFGVDLA